MLWSWGISRLAASSFCCDLTSFLMSKLAASQKKLNLTARNSSFWLFLGSKNLTTSFKIWIAQHSFVVEQSCKWQKHSRVRRQFKSASTFDLGCVTFLGRVTKNDMTIASDRRKYLQEELLKLLTGFPSWKPVEMVIIFFINPWKLGHIYVT